MAYDNTNRGALFKNNRKQQPNHPDYTGKINSDGYEYWVSGWIKEKRDNGEKYLSLALTPVQQAQQAAPPQPPPPQRRPQPQPPSRPPAHNQPPAEEPPPSWDTEVPF